MKALKNCKRVLNKIIKRSNKEELPDIFAELKARYNRAHHRHSISQVELGYLEAGGRRFRLVNISYGGLALGENEFLLRPFIDKNRQFKGRLYLLDLYIDLTLEVRFARENIIGCKFNTFTEIEEEFIKNYIKFMDVGLLLEPLDHQQDPKYYREDNWQSFSNKNRSIVIQLELIKPDILKQFNIIFIVDGIEYTITYSPENSSITSSKPRKFDTKAKKMALRQCFAILVGLYELHEISPIKQILALIRQGLC